MAATPTHAPSRFVAQTLLREPPPGTFDYSWCGHAGSGVPFFGNAAARRTIKRWASQPAERDVRGELFGAQRFLDEVNDER